MGGLDYVFSSDFISLLKIVYVHSIAGKTKHLDISAQRIQFNFFFFNDIDFVPKNHHPAEHFLKSYGLALGPKLSNNYTAK